MMGHGHRPSASRRGTSESGAVIVEMAFIVVILLTLVAGAFDYGYTWRYGLVANEGARTGARVGSGQALSRGADYYALNGVRSSLQSGGVLDDVRKVIIFKSSSANGVVPSTCTATTSSGTCNVLTGAQFKALTLTSYDLTISTDPTVAPTGTGCLKTASATRVGWCPSARSNNQDTGADYYGVYVELYYTNKFSILGAGTTVKRTAVMRLEPTGFGA